MDMDIMASGTNMQQRLDFDVGPDENTLNLDNSQIYPPSISLAFQPHYVTQVDPSSEEGVRLRITGFEFELNGAETISEEGTELLPMMLKISSIENMPMNPPSLQINVLKDSQGRLMIASFNKAEPSQAVPSDKDCNEWPLYCKWKSIMADRLERLKHMGKPRPNCHMRPHGHMASEMAGKPPHRMHHGMGHHDMGHSHGRHGQHHHHHRFTMFIRRAFFTIFVPILIGIFAGTLTYLVGMALGCLIAMTVAKFRGQRYQPIALSEDDVEDIEDLEAQEDGEKEEYAELPAYDAPPVYEDAADKTADETK
ncbi:hypothetical protein ACJBU6_04384 [Exserohilum turcicum]